jgi:hypothetical protein
MLKPSDIKTLQRLLRKAGSEAEFQQAVKRAQQLPKRDQGRPARNDNLDFLIYIELLCRINERYGIKRNTTLKRLIYQTKDGLLGKTQKAAVHRIANRLRDKKFKDQFTDETIRAVAEAYPDPRWGQHILAVKQRLDEEWGMHMSEDDRRSMRKATKVIQGSRR